MLVLLKSSEQFTRLDQLQTLRHHQRPLPPFYSYHNDLSGATGRVWEVMIRVLQEPPIAWYGQANQPKINAGQSKLFKWLLKWYVASWRDAFICFRMYEKLIYLVTLSCECDLWVVWGMGEGFLSPWWLFITQHWQRAGGGEINE